VSPALAQSAHYSGFEAPRGATATLNFKVPLGKQARATAEKPSYGLTLGYGQTLAAPGLDGRTTSRSMKLADIRFDSAGLAKAEVATFNLAAPEKDKRLQMFGDGGANTTWIIIGLVAVGVGVCLIADCFEDDDDDNDDADI
jgi:hypothetical protein